MFFVTTKYQPGLKTAYFFILIRFCQLERGTLAVKKEEETYYLSYDAVLSLVD